jgi:hypothetical protein
MATRPKFAKMYRVQAKWLANVGRMYRVRPIFQNGHFGKYSNSPKLANFWRVLECDKFAGEWPLLSQMSKKRNGCKGQLAIENVYYVSVTPVLVLFFSTIEIKSYNFL